MSTTSAVPTKPLAGFDARSLKPIYYQARLSRDEAVRRESFLKTGKGKRFLENRLAAFPEDISPNKLERY